MRIIQKIPTTKDNILSEKDRYEIIHLSYSIKFFAILILFGFLAILIMYIDINSIVQRFDTKSVSEDYYRGV